MQKKIQKWFWPAVLALQCIILLVLTWHAPAELLLDDDAAKAYTHTLEMWRNGTFLIPGWHYQTSLEIDTAALLALPFYGLTGNIFLSFRLANTLLIPLGAALCLFLLRRLGAAWNTCCQGTLLVLLPYEFFFLGYWNMMFLNHAPYFFRAFLSLALAVLLLPISGKHPGGGYWAGAVVFLALTGLNAFSSGAHVLLCGLFPVLVWRLWLWWDRKEKLDIFTSVLWLGTWAASAAGMALARITGVYNRGDSTILNTVFELPETVSNCFAGIFNLFGAVNSTPVPALSVDGMDRLLRVVFVLCLLAALIAAVRAVVINRYAGEAYLTAIAVWNLFVLCVTKTDYGIYFEYRYHLVGMVPVLLLFALYLPRLRLSVRELALLGVLALTLMTDWSAARATSASALNDTEDREAARAVQLLETIDELNIDVPVVYLENQSGLAEFCRLLDPERRYVAYEAEHNNRLVAYDYYWADADAATWNGPCLYAVSVGSQPPEKAEYIGTGSEHDFYRADENRMDGTVGFVSGDRMVDYPDSPVYECVGEMDDERRLHAQGQADVLWVIRSPTLTFHTMTDVTLEYTAQGGEPGLLELWQQEDCLFTVPLTKDASQVSLSGILPGEYIVKVSLPEGSAAVLGPITFTRTGQ